MAMALAMAIVGMFLDTGSGLSGGAAAPTPGSVAAAGEPAEEAETADTEEDD